MNRINTMARFTEPDEVNPVCECVCCGAELYEGEYAYMVDDEAYCSTMCVIDTFTTHKQLTKEDYYG